MDEILSLLFLKFLTLKKAAKSPLPPQYGEEKMNKQLPENSPAPFFSIIIPSYNNGSYLQKCIQSLQRQSFKDWEAIIVIDASPDNAFHIASQLAEKDNRILIINKPQNEGTHLARKSGVERARGSYALFLDADDELTNNALASLSVLASQQSFDVLHFGTELFGENMPESTCSDILQLSNRDLPTLHGQEIVLSSFTDSENHRQDWRILQRLYRTGLLKESFKCMSNSRLGRGQDSYEWLVIASLADTEVFHNEVIGYRYYLGRGITTFQPMSKQKFVSLSSNYGLLLHTVSEYASNFSRFDLSPCVTELRRRLLEMLFGDWYVRLSDEDKVSVLNSMQADFTHMEIATELMRLTRDDAYSHWDSGDSFDKNARYVHWENIAESLAGSNSNPQYEEYRRQALRHFSDLQTRLPKPKQTTHFSFQKCGLLLSRIKKIFFSSQRNK